MNKIPNVDVATAHERKAYATPNLEVLGSVVDLMKSGNSNSSESSGRMSGTM